MFNKCSRNVSLNIIDLNIMENYLPYLNVSKMTEFLDV